MFRFLDPTRRKGAVVLGLLLALVTTDAAAVSQNAAISLTFPIGSQYSSTGEAGTAVARDVTAQWWNLGGFAFAGDGEKKSQGHAMYSQLVPDLADDVALYWFGGSTAVEGWGVLGFSLTYLDQGEQIGTDLAGNETDRFSSSEWAIQGSYGTKILENFGFGVGLKYVRISLAPGGVIADVGESGEGSSWGVDLGMLYDFNTPDYPSVIRPLQIGATVTNWGSDVTFVDEQQADPLPFNYRLGLAYDILNTTQSRLTLIYDFMDMLVEGDETQVNGVGAEWTYANILSVRAGYKSDPEGDIQSATWGFGFDLERAIGTPLIFDYARVPQASDLDEVDRFSLGVRF